MTYWVAKNRVTANGRIHLLSNIQQGDNCNVRAYLLGDERQEAWKLSVQYKYVHMKQVG